MGFELVYVGFVVEGLVVVVVDFVVDCGGVEV